MASEEEEVLSFGSDDEQVGDIADDAQNEVRLLPRSLAALGNESHDLLGVTSTTCLDPSVNHHPLYKLLLLHAAGGVWCGTG